MRNPGTLRAKDTFEMAVSPSRSFEREPKCVSADTGALVGEFPTALLPREIMANSPDRIRALICFGGDPLMALGDPALASAAFEQLDLLVSLDCRLNETGKAADYVIATTQPFERPELSVSGDGMFPEAFVQYTEAVVAPPPGVIHDWEVFWGLAARMGVALTFKFWNYGLNYRDIADGLPLSMTEKPDPRSAVPLSGERQRGAVRCAQGQPGRGAGPAMPRAGCCPRQSDGGRLELCPPDVAAELAALAQEQPEAGISLPPDLPPHSPCGQQRLPRKPRGAAALSGELCLDEPAGHGGRGALPRGQRSRLLRHSGRCAPLPAPKTGCGAGWSR